MLQLEGLNFSSSNKKLTVLLTEMHMRRIPIFPVEFGSAKRASILPSGLESPGETGVLLVTGSGRPSGKRATLSELVTPVSPSSPDLSSNL